MGTKILYYNTKQLLQYDSEIEDFTCYFRFIKNKHLIYLINKKPGFLKKINGDKISEWETVLFFEHLVQTTT